METLFFAGQLSSSFYSYEAFHNVHRLYIANFIERNLSHFFEGYIPGFYLPSLLSWGVFRSSPQGAGRRSYRFR